LVGREGELSRLVGALGGDTRLVLVTGDAGVGKTRLVAEGMAQAAAGGMVLVRGECLPVAGTLPLLPVASALGELAKLGGGHLIETALGTVPEFVRAEVGRLVPQLGPGRGSGSEGPGEGWQRERLFAAVAQLLDVVGEGSASGVGLVVEDVHWADSDTLDCLTFLSRAAQSSAVRVVVTCRSDEAPLAPQVDRWLAQARSAVATEEITLGPLSRPEVTRQVAALAGRPVPPALVDELYTRAEGNPFFTEQLMAAALVTGATDGGPQVPAALPARLAGLLASRAGRCGSEARAVLDALAVAGRPLGEDLLGAVTGLHAEAAHRGLRELAAARLLADGTTLGGGHRPRHALLAEAVTAGLLPGERARLHERTARALEACGDSALAGEAAGHWQAAGRRAEELPTRVAAAEAAERVFGYAEAARHWQRAIELRSAVPEAAQVVGIDLPRFYVRAIDAFHLSGDSSRASALAEEACHRFADHPDPATAAVVCHRAAFFRPANEPDAGRRALLEEALRLFEQGPPSAEHAAALLDYADDFHQATGGRSQASIPALLNRALEIAEAAGATPMASRILSNLAYEAFLCGQVEEGQGFLDRGRALAQDAQDGGTLLWLAVVDSEVQLTLARFHHAAEVARHGLQNARQAGLEASVETTILIAYATEALLALGRTAEAAALVDPLITGPPDRSHWLVHDCRAEIDLLRGDIEMADQRRQQIKACARNLGHIENAREFAQRAAELALWAGRPSDALEEVQRVLPLFKTRDLTIFCGPLLGSGMRACADLAEQARARRDEPTAEDAVAAADGLVMWAERMSGAPFIDHPYMASIPAERATWEAERTRLAGDTDPAAWAAAAKTWDGLGCPHRAAYAWWRQAQAQLDAGQPPTAAAAALRSAAAAADGHRPLLAEIRKLADRARIPLHPPAATVIAQVPPPRVQLPYGLTGRELAVLRLVAAGRSNAQIGAELFISRATAAVHVTSILRKLGVTNRVQAAALAERAGLLDSAQP
jgi:DNA-binding CsgD family transcriptional regulator/tetratricopeptide (TPR) repeat protein